MKISKLIRCCSLCGLLFVCLLSNKSNINTSLVLESEIAYPQIDVNNEFNKSGEEIISYQDVLRKYYSLAIHGVSKPTKSFEEFYGEYYADDSDRNLYEFTFDLAEENGNLSYVREEIKIDDFNVSPASFSSGGGAGGGKKGQDANYVLKSTTDYSFTPKDTFARVPYKSIYDYSSLKNGDIIYETETIFFNAGHNALITDINHPSYYGNYIQTVEAVGGGVQFGFLDDLRMTYFKCKILRVRNADSQDISSAIYFAKRQINKIYILNPIRLNTDINSPSWYCSELVYASYKFVGIDIGVKKDSNGNDVYLKLGCLPADIYNSYNTYTVYMPYYGFLSLRVIEKKGGVWHIMIGNTSSVGSYVYYNTKMCNLGDAKEWKGLS